MSLARILFRLRIFLTVLSGAALLLAAQAEASMPIHGNLLALVLCSDGQMSTVWIDTDGNEQDAPDDCRACPDCCLPVAVAGGPNDQPIYRATWQRLTAVPAATVLAVPLQRVAPPARGPPAFL